MVERLKGDVAVEIDGEPYTLRFSGAALMAIEDAFGGESFQSVLMRFGEAGAAGKSQPVRDVAKIVQAALRRHHPDLTIEQAADLAFDPAMQDALGAAIEAAFPQVEAGADAPADPPKRAGTGRKR